MGLGDIRNIRTAITETLEDLIYISPEERLKKINNFEPSLELIDLIPRMIPGDVSELILNIINRNVSILVKNRNILQDIIFVNDFYRRFKTIEDTTTRKHMVIALSDLFEQRLIYNKEHDIKKHISISLVAEKEMNFYKQLLEIFERDKKTLVTLIRLYPSMIQAITDKEMAKIIYSEILADIIKDNVNPSQVLLTLNIFMRHLENISDTEEDIDWFIQNECNFYFKRIMYAINDIFELNEVSQYAYNSFKNTTSMHVKKMYHKLFTILSDIIKDSIGNDFKNKYKDITSISLNDLENRTQLIREAFNQRANKNITNKSILSYMDTLAEVMINYNNLFADSDIMRGTLSSTNNEYATTLLNISTEEDIPRRYTHIVEYIDYCRTMITDIEPEILRYMNMTLSKICKHFESGIFYIKEKLIKYNVKELKNNGFIFKDGSFGSFNDVLDHRIRDIRTVFGSTKDMLNYIIDARYSMSAKDMMREMVITADVIGRKYDGHALHKLFEANILNFEKEKFLSELCNILFGFQKDNIEWIKLYNIEYINKYLCTKSQVQVSKYKNIIRDLDLDTFYRLSKIAISDNIYVEAEEEEKPLFIEDLDFSDYDFGDSILLDEVDIFDLSVYQVLRQMVYNNLNLLTTSMAESHDLYLSIVQMMEEVLS